MTLDTFTPGKDLVLVENVSNEEKTTASGLILTEKSLVQQGRLLRRHPEVNDFALNDVLVFSKTQTIPITIGGTVYLLLKVKDVMGSFRENKVA